MYQIFVHLTYSLIAVSFLLRDILWLRITSIVASSCSITFSYILPGGPVWEVIGWNCVFILINGTRIVLLIRERMQVNFSDEEREIYDKFFSNFPAVDFMKLMRVAKWDDIDADTTLIEQGETVHALLLIYRGEASIRVDGKEVVRQGDGAFIGEMSFMTNQPASATVVTVGPTRMVSWPKLDLMHMLDRNPNIRMNLQGILGTDMARKLQTQGTKKDEN